MNSEEFTKWAEQNNIFVSKVLFKITLFRFAGIYFLNACKFNWIPRFYGAFRSYWIECGLSWLGYMVEFQYNK